MRILLVEDTDDARELLAFVLEQCAAVVTAKGSAAEGLEAFLRERGVRRIDDWRGSAMPSGDAVDEDPGRKPGLRAVTIVRADRSPRNRRGVRSPAFSRGRESRRA